MPKPTSAFVFHAPFGPRDVLGHQHENAAYQHAEWLRNHGTPAIAVIGGHSRDEVQAALRSLRRVYLAQTAESEAVAS